jgi:hypothetical protein
MKKTIGFTFSVGGLHYVVLEGTKNSPSFIKKNKITLPPNLSASELVEWYQTQIELILNSEQPEEVNYKLSINNVTNDLVQKVYYGQAILNLVCKKKNITIGHISSNSIVPSKFGLPKKSDLHSFLETKIGAHPPHWDKTMKDTALIALNILP